MGIGSGLGLGLRLDLAAKLAGDLNGRGLLLLTRRRRPHIVRLAQDGRLCVGHLVRVRVRIRVGVRFRVRFRVSVRVRVRVRVRAGGMVSSALGHRRLQLSYLQRQSSLHRMRGNAGSRRLQQQRQRGRVTVELEAPDSRPYGARIDRCLAQG